MTNLNKSNTMTQENLSLILNTSKSLITDKSNILPLNPETKLIHHFSELDVDFRSGGKGRAEPLSPNARH